MHGWTDFPLSWESCISNTILCFCRHGFRSNMLFCELVFFFFFFFFFWGGGNKNRFVIYIFVIGLCLKFVVFVLFLLQITCIIYFTIQCIDVKAKWEHYIIKKIFIMGWWRYTLPSPHHPISAKQLVARRMHLRILTFQNFLSESLDPRQKFASSAFATCFDCVYLPCPSPPPPSSPNPRYGPVILH